MAVTNKHRLSKALLATLSALLIAESSPRTCAATLTWTGAAGDNNVSNAANWSPAQVPVNGDVLIYAGTAGLAPQLNTALNVGSLTFNTGSGAFALGGSGTYTVGANGITNSSASTETINTALRLGANQNWKAATGALVVNGPVNLQSFTMTNTGNRATTIGGSISGSGGLTQNGKGSITLSGANTHTGTTTLRSGTLNIASDTALGTGTLSITGNGKLDAFGGSRTLANAVQIASNFTFNGTNSLALNGATSMSGNSTITSNGTGSLTLGGTFTSSKTLTKAGTGSLGLFGANGTSFTGQLKLNAGRLIVGNTGSTGTGLLTVATATIEAAGAARTIPNAITLTGNPTFSGAFDLTFTGTPTFGGVRTLSVLNPLTTFSSAITGGATGIIKTGAGSLMLSGANTFGSGTVIQDGTVILDSNTAAGAAASTITVGNVTAGSSTAASLLFSATAGRTVANPINIPAGSTGLRTIGGMNATGVNIFSGGVTLGTAATLTAATGGEVRFTGIISGANNVTKTGGGTVRLGASNTYTGSTLITAGKLAYGVNNALATGPITINGGDLDIATFTDIVGAVTLENGSITGTTGVLIGTTGFTVRNGTISARLGGAVAMTKDTAGTVTLSGANIFTGGTNVNAGTLAFGAGNILADAGVVNVNGGTLNIGGFSDTVGAVNLASGSILGTTGTLTGTSYSLQSGTVTAALGGTAALTKTTAGLAVISGANTYTGATTISAGTLRSGASNTLPDSTVLSLSAGATLDLAGFSDTVGSIAGAGQITLGAARITTGGLNTSTTFGGDINGTGGITKTGTGTLTLSGINAYQGSTDIAAGTLAMGSAASGPAASRVNISAGAMLNLAGFNTTIGSLAGTGSITLGSGTLSSGSDNTTSSYSGSISGTGGFSKNGTGTNTLTGLNPFTGALAVNSGSLVISGPGGRVASASSVTVQSGATLTLDNSAGENADRIGSASAINIAGGDLRFVSDSNGSSESIGTLNFLVGPASVTVVHNGAATDTTSLTFSSIGTIAPGTSLNFDAVGGTLGADATGPQILFTGLANGLMGSWAHVGGDFAEYSVHGVRAFSDYYEGSLGINLNDPSKIIRLSAASPAGAYTLTNAGTTSDGGLSLTDIAAVHLNTDATRTLNLAGGGLIKSGTPATTISGAGRLTAGGSAAAAFNITVNGTSSLSVLSNIIDNAGSDGTYGNAGDGSVTLVKSGAGMLSLAGTNTFSGGVIINDGTIESGSDSAFGAPANDVLINAGGIRASASFTLGAGRTITIASGLSGVIDIAPVQTLSLTAAANQLTTGNTGSRAVKTGTGALVLGTANTSFSGTMEILAGTVEMRNGDALGGAAQRGTIALNGGTLRLAADASTTFSHPLQLITNGTIEAAPLTSGSPVHSLGSVNIGSQTLSLAATGGATLSLAGATLTGDAVFNTTTGTSALGPVSGGFGFTKSGAGTLALSGTGTFTGATNVTDGTLLLTTSSALPLTSLVNPTGTGTVNLNGLAVNFGSIGGNGTIALGGGTLTVGGNLTASTFAGTISGNGSLVKIGPETLTLGSPSTYTGTTSINAGTLLLAATDALPAATTVAVATGAMLNVGAASQTLAGMSGAGTVDLGTGSLTIANASGISFGGTLAGAGSFIKSGSGTLTLTGSNTNTGTISVSVGSLHVASSGALGSIAGGTDVSPGGSIRLQTGISISTEALSLAGNGTAGEGALSLATGTAAWNGPISLSDDSSIASGGALTLGGAIALSGRELSLSGSGNITASGIISGTGALVKSGSGTATLSRANTFTGPLVLQAGRLAITNDAALGASGSGNETEIQSGASLVLDTAAGVSSDESLLISGNGTTGTGAIVVLNAVNILAGNIRMTGDASLDTDVGAYLSIGPVGDSGAGHNLTKNGLGLLTLAGANTFSGDLIVNAGTVKTEADNRFGGISGIILAPGSTLDLNDFSDSLAELSGTGTISFGPVGGGTLSIGSRGTNSTFTGTISGTGELLKEGAGTITFTTPNAFTGITSLGVEGGALDIGSTVQTSGPVTVVSGAISGSTGSFIAPSYDLTDGSSSAVLAGAGSTLTVNGGSNLLTKINTFTGATQIHAGTLQIGVGGGLSGTSSVTVAAGAVLDNRGTINSTVAVAGTLEGTGSITGAVSVSAGGALSPGDETSIGAFSTGALSLGSGAVYELTLNTTAATADKITAAGSITLGAGVAGLATTDIFTQTLLAGTVLTILESTSGVSGFFAGMPEGTIFSTGLNSFRISYTADAGRDVTVTAVPEPSLGLLLAAGFAALALRRPRRPNCNP